MNGKFQDLYPDLLQLARTVMRRERRNHTLTPTDLFHEAYFRVQPHLKNSESPRQDVRALFAVTMRRVLIDYARKRTRRLRKLSQSYLPVENCTNPIQDPDRYEILRLEQLDSALKQFSIEYPVHAKLVELRVFGGHKMDVCAELLGISEATAHRHWNFSKATLMRQIKKSERQ
ncbi:MAG: sigma-70 family RNA polymerase sigma factor [Planctomycetota bacterium]|jgi:RNA polymerase sigma-70 factor (ECF subfamily)